MPNQPDILIVIFLRGGADGLHMVVPHGEAHYYSQRDELAIAAPGKENGALELDGFFGMHPALEPLLPTWQAGQLALVHACGSPDPSHSHFEAMDLMERGTLEERSITSGWLGRYLATTANQNDSPLRAVGFGALLQASLRGGMATAISSLENFALQANRLELPRIKAAHGQIYRGNGPLFDTAQQTLNAAETIAKLNPAGYRPSDGAVYPESPYGQALKQIALLIKADVGLQVACADIGDWDTHVAQGGAEGELATNLSEFSAGLRALYTDLGAHLNRICLVTMSEFGRRVAANGGGGTDHGHGNVMLVMGGGVSGGAIYGDWPGLHPEQLYGPGDLAITTDYRDVLGELLDKRLGGDLARVFPGYKAYTPRNIVRT